MISKDSPVVYIASKLSGNIKENVEKTKEYSRFVIEQGCVPLNPILNLNGVISEETGRADALEIDIRLLHKADELWAFGPPTSGMIGELYEAKLMGIPRRVFTTYCKEVRHGEDGELFE